MTYDSVRDRVVMFGGATTSAVLNASPVKDDTWEWDGIGWNLAATTGPSARRLAALTFDTAAAVTVLFGGSSTNSDQLTITPLDDTWTWNGTAWTERTPPTVPPARESAAIAYDPIRKRVVMFGGTASYVPLRSLGDTWEWDGTNWIERTPASSPPARAAATMSYDPGRRRILLAAGRADAGSLEDAWEWDGMAWTELSPQGSPGPIIATIYNPLEQRLIAFGDADYRGVSNDTWALEFRTPLAKHELCITGDIDDDGDGLAGCADPDCWARCTPQCPPGATCAATASRCGDAACDPLENPSLCPADCK